MKEVFIIWSFYGDGQDIATIVSTEQEAINTIEYLKKSLINKGYSEFIVNEQYYYERQVMHDTVPIDILNQLC